MNLPTYLAIVILIITVAVSSVEFASRHECNLKKKYSPDIEFVYDFGTCRIDFRKG